MFPLRNLRSRPTPDISRHSLPKGRWQSYHYEVWGGAKAPGAVLVEQEEGCDEADSISQRQAVFSPPTLLKWSLAWWSSMRNRELEGGSAPPSLPQDSPLAGSKTAQGPQDQRTEQGQHQSRTEAPNGR